jgi:diguanylate cyclase (GGDEF)-like protein/PAS domain S-box-containing protein
MRFELSIRNAVLAGIAAAAVVTALFLCARAFLDFTGRLGSGHEDSALLSVASASAAALDPGTVASLKGSSADIGTPAFDAVRQRLKRMRGVLPGARFVYLMGARNNTIYFMADAEPPGSSAYSPPGRIYNEDTARLRHVFNTGKPVIDGPATDRWGTSLSGLAPVFDPQTGKVIAVLGIDVPAGAWPGTDRRDRAIALAVSGVVALLLALLAVSVFLYVLVRRYVVRLDAEHAAQVRELAIANRIVENSSTVICRFDLDDTWPLAYISRNVERYGYEAGALLDKPNAWLALFHEDDRAAIRADVERLKSGKIPRTRREARLRRADGSWAWVDLRLSIVPGEMPAHLAAEGVLFDISDAKRAEKEIAHLATHDALTGLVNRPAFLERLQMAFAETRRGGDTFAVHYLDIDHFKDVNDAFGHEKGDLLLKAVAERMAAMLRETDVLGRLSVARFGGDEFAVLQTAVSEPDDAAVLAQRLNKALAEPFLIGGNDIHITVSIGISICDSSVVDPNDMLMHADLALYRAKDAGRNQFNFHSRNLETEVRERVAIAEDLHVAIENNQLELHYQPQVEIPSGRITGMEALVRWNHPTRGMMWPDLFISVAEKSGMIGALGQWVIRRACRQIREWRDIGLSPPLVGVNVSAVQFQKPETLVTAIRESLAESAVEAAMLELELTESVLIETTVSHSDILERLRGLGVRIAVDDFGTGYSSLQYLHSYPIGRIKIAQQFMRDLTGAGGDAAIVRAVIEMGRALQLDVIAEGVETGEQAEFLSQAGCHKVQGYYFSPPVRAGNMAALLRMGAFAYPRPAGRQHAGAA